MRKNSSFDRISYRKLSLSLLAQTWTWSDAAESVVAMDRVNVIANQVGAARHASWHDSLGPASPLDRENRYISNSIWPAL